MVHGRNKLPRTISFVSIPRSKGVKFISELTMNLAKKRNFDIWPKQRFLRSLVGFMENVLSQHHFIQVLKVIYNVFEQR